MKLLHSMEFAAGLIGVAATVAATPATASVRLATPLLPTALVEDVKSAAGEVEFMDYVGMGQVIHLAPRDVLVLSYLKSCAHETITGGASGGSVTVGSEASEVQGAQIVRAKVACDGGKIRLSSQLASKSAASTFRVQSVETEPTLFARAPIVKLPIVAGQPPPPTWSLRAIQADAHNGGVAVGGQRDGRALR